MAAGKRSSEQEAFAQELKDCVDSLVEAYVNVLNAGKFHSKVSEGGGRTVACV